MFSQSFTQTFSRNPSRQINYLLEDDFRIAASLAAGSVNGTLATDGVNVRTVTDPSSKISISGLLSFATGADINSGLWYTNHVRTTGRAMVTSVIIPDALGDIQTGIDVNASGIIQDGFRFLASNIRGQDAASTRVIGTYATGTRYQLAIVERTSGYFMFVKGGTFANWTLLWISSTTTTATLFPGFMVNLTTSPFSVDFVRIPDEIISIAPSASDSFNRANGAIGSTDGLAVPESGGGSLSWREDFGTWVISSNAAKAATLTSSTGIATIDAGSPNVIVTANLTRAALFVGIALRFLDANNFIYIYKNFANVNVARVVGGTPVTLTSTAAAYVAGAALTVSAIGSKFRVYYNGAFVSETNIADAALQTPTRFGLYTSDLGNTIDNFIVFLAGNENQYLLFEDYVT